MEMCYEGTLAMPSNYVVMDSEEMTYLYGGYVYTDTGSAKTLKNKASNYMKAWFALSATYTYQAAACVVSAVGVGVGVIGGIGAAYCTFAGNEYRQAFNYFSTQKQSKSCYMKTISNSGFVTGVTYGLGSFSGGGSGGGSR